MEVFDALIARVRACRLCEPELALGARPVLQVSPSARILIVGQAPGTRVHASGVPFDDPSGDRLRAWLGVDREQFYDAARIALVPMGFCYPGRGKGGDLPPDPRCAATWRAPVLEQMPNIGLTLVLGAYAQAWHLPETGRTLADTVRRWREFAPEVIPAPHPSPRNNRWLAKNPWFKTEVVPYLRKRLNQLL